MNAMIRTTPVAVLVALGLTLGAQAAEPLPYGHKDFVPTPERPVYFRQTYGNYPGATPPLEWWDGTPTSKKVGNAMVVDFADQKSKNILWKVPVPGWSLSHPIVVGPSTGSGQGRVFAVGEPDFVTCWDLDTGKQLWQRRIMPLLCDDLPEEKATAGQKVLDLARALWLVSSGGSTSSKQKGNLYNYGVGDGPAPDPGATPEQVAVERTAFADKVLRMAQKHRPDVEAFGDADLLKALDEDIAILQSWAKAKDPAAMTALLKDSKARSTRLVSACARKFGIPFGGAWWGFCGTADSTLASDGQRIYGVFAQGQVFALDLDGKTVWLQREKSTRIGGNENPFHRSPLLCGDLLLVRSCIVPGKTQPLRAFDVATGKLRWETPLAASSHAVPCLMRLPGADGKSVDVLVSNMSEGKDKGQAVLRVADGKILGYLPSQLIARGPLMAVFGQQVTWIEDSGPACSYSLCLDGTGAVVAEEVFVIKDFRQHNIPTVTGTIMQNHNRLFDATTGKVISNLPGQVGQLGSVVAGHHLITLNTAGGWHGDVNNSPMDRARGDRMTFGVYSVTDIKDPAKPVVVAKNNLLGYKEPAADIIVSTYLKEFDPYLFAGCYKGSASYFAMMGGPVPHGDKLLIQSSAFLYCIGLRQGSGPHVGEK